MGGAGAAVFTTVTVTVGRTGRGPGSSGFADALTEGAGSTRGAAELGVTVTWGAAEASARTCVALGGGAVCAVTGRRAETTANAPTALSTRIAATPRISRVCEGGAAGESLVAATSGEEVASGAGAVAENAVPSLSRRGGAITATGSDEGTSEAASSGSPSARESAATASPALAKRACGSREQHFVNHPSNARGSPSPRSLGTGSGSYAICATSAVSVVAVHGSAPPSSRCAMIPSAQMSVAGEMRSVSPFICSGDM